MIEVNYNSKKDSSTNAGVLDIIWIELQKIKNRPQK